MKTKTKSIKFTATKSSGDVSGIIIFPDHPKYFLLFAHGAGAGMNNSFMEKMSACLADKNIGTLRFNFPYMEKERKGPDPAPILMETIRSAVKTLRTYVNVPIFAGGKSMGGRMTSMADSKEPLGVKGIIFFGFPLHAPGKPSNERAEHLFNVSVPMLFLQGKRDKLADLKLLNPVIKKLKDRAAIYIMEGADHSFHMMKSSGRNDEEVMRELMEKVGEWMKTKNS